MPVTSAAPVLPNPLLFLSLFWRKLPPEALASDTIRPRRPMPGPPGFSGYVVVCRLISSPFVLFELIFLTLCSVCGVSDWSVLRCPPMRYCCVPHCTQRSPVSRFTRYPPILTHAEDGSRSFPGRIGCPTALRTTPLCAVCTFKHLTSKKTARTDS